jgi:uncharacterized protein (DUF934 family)
MATIYKDGEFVEETWVRADSETGPAADGDLLVPVSLFLEAPEAHLCRTGKTALLVEAGEKVGLAAEHLGKFAYVAVAFPSFADGRGSQPPAICGNT